MLDDIFEQFLRLQNDSLKVAKLNRFYISIYVIPQISYTRIPKQIIICIALLSINEYVECR